MLSSRPPVPLPPQSAQGARDDKTDKAQSTSAVPVAAPAHFHSAALPSRTAASPGAGAVKLAPLPCGIVLFDHPEEGTSGTAYLPLTAPQRIRSPNDLRNDALWVSNMPVYDQRVRGHPTMRSGYYFHTTLANMASDMGVQSSRDGQMSPDDAMRMATLFTRTMTIAARAYGWDVSEDGPLRVQEDMLCRDIAKMLPNAPVPDKRFREDVSSALMQAYQGISEPAWPTYTFEPDSVFVTLRFNRTNYARQILEAPVPSGRGWARLDGLSMGTETMDFCLNNPTVVKASVEWTNASSDLAALAAYGQAGKRRNNMRLWLSQPELVWISQYARVTISSIWVDQSGCQPLPDSVKLPALFTMHPESCLSYSAGLVASNHLSAVADARYSWHAKKEEATIWGVWLKALDRAQMFAMALKAFEAGFHVERYGDGSLTVRVNRARLGELAEFKEEHGFMHPDLASLVGR